MTGRRLWAARVSALLLWAGAAVLGALGAPSIGGLPEHPAIALPAAAATTAGLYLLVWVDDRRTTIRTIFITMLVLLAAHAIF
jgi:hypothetical protein